MSSIRYLGHSTVYIEVDEAHLLTDPLLRRRVGHLLRAVPIPPLDELDAVLVSHAHRDHLDLPSIGTLDPSLPVVLPRGLGRLLKRRDDVREVEVGDELVFDDVKVRATEAAHGGSRPGGRAKGPALGYVIEGSRRVYFAGDTDLFPAMEGLVEDLDVALIPIWGWGPSLGRGLHLDPAGAAEAIRRLKPRIAIPIHWGTYRPFHHGPRARFLKAPADAFAREAAARAPDVEVRVLQPGEKLDL
jgi:L-ascorbate metabolism protein UlaG (beta-lactamase superfamily)